MLIAYLIGSIAFNGFMAACLAGEVIDAGEMDGFDKAFGLVLAVLIPMGLAILMKEI